MADALRRRAQQFLRTAHHAHKEDLDAAYENARAAAELAAKALLKQAGVPNDRDHNVAPALVHHGILPPGEAARELSRFLQNFTRGRYGVDEPVEAAELQEAMRIATWIVNLCQDGAAPQP